MPERPQPNDRSPLPQRERVRQAMILLKGAQARIRPDQWESGRFVYTTEDVSDSTQYFISLIRATPNRREIDTVQIRIGRRRRSSAFFGYTAIRDGEIIDSAINSAYAVQKINDLFNDFSNGE